MSNYWQPSIDRWILQESDMPHPSTANTTMNANDSSHQSHLFGADLMSGGMPVKSEEEENAHDKLSQPYKGITTLHTLQEKIHEVLERVYTLSKTDKDSRTNSNPYEVIKNLLDSPDLKAMLDLASTEIKKRFVSV